MNFFIISIRMILFKWQIIEKFLKRNNQIIDHFKSMINHFSFCFSSYIRFLTEFYSFQIFSDRKNPIFLFLIIKKSSELWIHFLRFICNAVNGRTFLRSNQSSFLILQNAYRKWKREKSNTQINWMAIIKWTKIQMISSWIEVI